MTGVPPRGTRALCLAGGACIVAAFLFGFHAYGSQPVGVETRADVIFIDTLARFGPLQRQPVAFQHDLHTKALLRETDKDCTLCHMVDERGSLSLLFKRLQDTDTQGMLDLYHDNCMGCHARLRKAGAEAGPVTCGGCHPRRARILSSISPAGFDLSMHSRHIELCENKCESCHHQYDEAKKTLYYAKGQEVSCRDCHRGATEENRLSMRAASHEACIGCHRGYSTSVEEEQAPLTCGGCHSAERQQRTQPAGHVARLQRGQPDLVVLHAAKEDLAASRMNTVPFDHEAHEGAVTTCRACHHETLKACRECHRLAAAGKTPTLETAMHTIQSPYSCEGCHSRETQKPQCAGCHASFGPTLTTESRCLQCHSGPKPEGSLVQKNPTAEARAPSAARPYRSFSFPRERIPEEVSIGILEETYERALFPHAKIVSTLLDHIERSSLALAMHGSQDLVCQGCHHQAPTSAQPPLCVTCHGKGFNKKDPHSPRLIAAYHLQCMGCHQRMGIQGLSGCTACHKAKGSKTSGDMHTGLRAQSKE